MTILRQSLLVGTAILMTAAMPGISYAQTASPAAEDETGIDEIVVTAQRREENLQDVPISVSAFGAKQIAEKGLTDVSRLEGLVPGFTFGRSGVDARPAIRGVRTESVDVNADTTIGLFIDGIYQSRSSQATLGFVDLERVEVQRGPQGTLYGRNTFGGNMSISTAQPDLTSYFGGADLTIGENSQVRITGYVNAALSEKVGLRIAGAYEKSNGWVKNVNPAGGNLFDDDNRYVRATLKLQPTEDLTATFKFDFSDRRGAGGSAFGYKLLGTYFYTPTNAQLFNATPFALNTRGLSFANGTVTATSGGNRDGVIDTPLTVDSGIPIFAANDPYKIDNDYPGTLQLRNYSGVANIAYDMGSATIKSITGLTDFKTTRTQDTDFSGNQLGADYQFTSAKTFSQELQVLSSGDGPLEYVFGAYYFKDKLTGIFINQQFPQIIRNVTPNITRPQVGGAYTQNRAETESVAVYGQASYNLTEKLKITAGIRATRDKKDFKFANANSVLPLTGVSPSQSTNGTLITFGTTGIPDSAFGVQGAPTNCTYAVNANNPAPVAGFQCRPGATEVFTGATFRTTTFKQVTWRAGLDYQLADDSLLYASASTGFSSGGFNGSLQAAALGRSTFAPQKVLAFEIGSKNRFADNTVQLNLSAFYNKYDGLQEQRQIPIGVTTTSIIENSGKARSYGAELEAIWKPVDALTLNASFAYLNAEYTKYDQVAAPFGTSILVADALATAPTIVNGVTIAPAGQRRLFAVGYNCGLIPGTGLAGQPAAAYGCDLSGKKIPHSPEYSGSVSAQYDIDLGSAGKLSPYAQLNFSGAFFGNPFNSILDRQSAFTKLDLRLTWELNDSFSLQGFVTNVTNKATATRFVYVGGGGLQSSFAPPRLWGLRGSVKF